jgi:hypothetical protein
MALNKILLDVSSVMGLDLTDTDELAYYIEQINQAGKEVYDSQDLPGSIKEQIFQVDDEDNYQVSFPHYVDKIRAIRLYNTSGGKITLEDLRPRYSKNRWGLDGKLKFRIKNSDSCLASEISNAGPLSFNLPTGKTEAVNLTITVVGKTADSEKVQEQVILVAGQNSVSTVGAFERVDTIIKGAYNTYDITIKDIDDSELGVIPNSELRPLYTIVQIREDDSAYYGGNQFPLNTIEVLYKTRFTPFRNLFDEFPAPNCDKIIFWKFCEHYSAYKPGLEQRAIMASIKVKELIKELNDNDEQGKTIKVQYGSNPMYDAQENRHCSGMRYEASRYN